MADKHWPIDPSTPVSSPFGYRGAFAIEGSADWLAGLHDGTDFAAPLGTPVYAAHAGYLRNLLDVGGYGQYVQVDGNGIMTQYGHVRDMWIVPDGTWVDPGTLIAGVGTEGMSTGPHLHFRLHVMGDATDPEPWLADAAWNVQSVGEYFHTTAEGAFLQWWVDNTDLPLPAIAGIAGNVQQESGFRPTAVEKAEQGYTLDTLDREAGPNANAAGYGLYQHSFDRLWADDGLLAWAAANGHDPHTMEGQNAYALWELQTRARFAGILDELRAAPDAHTAALIFGKFEGFNPAYEGLRNEYAVAIWDRIAAGEFGPLTRTTPPSSTAPRPRLTLGDDMATLWLVHEDGPNDNEPFGKFQEAWLWEGVPHKIHKPGIDLPGHKIQRSEWDAKVQAWYIAADLKPDAAWMGPAAGRPVFRPVKV